MAENTAQKPNVRTHRLVVYITEEDSQELYRASKLTGLSRSSFVSSILERMIIGGFAPLVGAKLCFQIQRRMEERGHASTGFYFGIRPLPPLPDEELSKRDSQALLNDIKHELKPC
jgi:hypothetical protein